MRPALHILPPAQRAFWEEATNIPENFVLYGGTALALRLAHRQSIDFDFFSTAPLDLPRLIEGLPWAGAAEILQRDTNTLTLRVDRGGPVVVSFFGNLSFGQLLPPEVARPAGIKIASLTDLLATKLKAVIQRSEAKDYVDIATMMERGVSLAAGLSGAVALFGPTFNPVLPLKALTYFGDGDLAMVPSEVRERLVRGVKETEELPKVNLHATTIGVL